ncbi:MBL fold metallo-hydrolase [Virgisporangium aurantiacum]|uniref:MBL fold metallo-hydrolase n=1 Tax=Virgisporangium aurantiacum TaxID=175570 RepID=A0A8J3ZAA2_9ACTN|nr:MBL fold metallo-hydrolase [Virgisporangium aurantiacum]GIJ59257.1 MBL fold metallo-hydrolase [Virgisporangium aurantiacum]
MKLTHLGHACLLVETDDARLLLDPGTMSEFEMLTDLTAVLVTHQHPDHLDARRVAALLAANPAARLVVDPDTATAAVFPDAVVARPGERLTFGRTTVDVHGGLHAAVYGDVPGCTNSAYLIDDGALFHPGDSFAAPPGPVDVLAVPIDGPWLKLSEAVDYVRMVTPRAAVPIHEGETTDPAKYAGMLAAFSPAGVVRRVDEL